MPIYEYICTDCHERFEKLARRVVKADTPPPPCPHCGSANTRRIVSAFARHGTPGVDYESLAAERAAAERKASITPRSLIEKWRSQEKKAG